MGGFVDECGARHRSGLHYDWPTLAVLNEDEYQTPPGGGVQYTICWDAWQREIAKVNPRIKLIGPETTNGGPSGTEQLAYSEYFMEPSHHADGRPPPIVSNHVGTEPVISGNYSDFFDFTDRWISTVGASLVASRNAHAPETELVVDEFCAFVSEWCEGSSGDADSGKAGTPCPDWHQTISQGVRINRKTMGWSASAASWA